MVNVAISRKLRVIMGFVVAFLILAPINAQSQASVPKPSTPEFTVQYVDNSHDMPPTYSKDPYTGETITSSGHWAKDQQIIITIKNQPFNPSNETYKLGFNVRVKGHFEEGQWTEIYSTSTRSFSCPQQQPDSENTIITLPANDYPSGAEVDVQVQAVISHPDIIYISLHPTLGPQYGTEPVNIIQLDKTSNWSSTQTVTVNGWLFILQANALKIVTIITIIIVAVLGLLVLIRRQKAKISSTQPSTTKT